MKRLFILVLLIVFLVSASACSLINNTSSEGTLPEDAAGLEQSAGDGTAKDTGGTEDASGADNAGTDASSASDAKNIEVTLYFPTEDNSALKKEVREIQVVDGAILKALILALAEGPETEGLRNPIPKGTEIIGISIKDKVAVVDFTDEFLATNGVEEVTTRLSVVNTLTEINGVEWVRLHINGEDMIGPSGMPLGDMGPASLNEDGTPAAGEIRTVKLYFSDSDAQFVVGEKRDVTLTKNDTLEKLVILELIKGPKTDDLWGAIPVGTKLISVSTKNGLCTVNFSKEFVDNSPGGTASERLAIGSVVNTLTELKGVEKVQFLIEGQKREIYTHAIFDKPFSRDEDMIAK